MRSRQRSSTAALVAATLTLSACSGFGVTRLEDRAPAAAGPTDKGPGHRLSLAERRTTGGRAVRKTYEFLQGNQVPQAARCATNSNPEHGFTADSLKIGTIMPLAGSHRAVNLQQLRVMRTTLETYLNSITKIPGPFELDWGCPGRPGIYGRKLELEVYPATDAGAGEGLTGARRLVEIEKVFAMQLCGADMLSGASYLNQARVPSLYCTNGDMNVPRLSEWHFEPGTDNLLAAALHVGYLVKRLRHTRLAVFISPEWDQTLPVILRVARYLGHPIPDECVILKSYDELQTGSHSEILQLRRCYGGRAPDAVIAPDLFAIFGAIEARDQGWDVQWTCLNSCWIEAFAELCGAACAGMITHCQILPCVPWADPKRYPMVGVMRDLRAKYFNQEPEDLATYGPAALSIGIAVWLAMTGPDLTRGRFRHTLENLKNWDAGIGPLLNTSPRDHIGGRSIWLVRFTGRRPWFNDESGRFIGPGEFAIPVDLTRNR